MPRVVRKCIHCDTTDGPLRLRSKFNGYLCEPCLELPQYVLKYYSNIKTDYFVDMYESDAEEFNTRAFSKPATMYRLSDILDYFCEVYEIDRQNNDAINNKLRELKGNNNRIKEQKEQKRRERQAVLEAKQKIESDNRRRNLIVRLREYKLELRNDSKLCHGYIEGTITDWSLVGVVKRMCEMKFLYDYCNMDHYLDKAYEYQQEEYEAGYFPDCTVFEQAEMMALRKHGPYPIDNKWPWL